MKYKDEFYNPDIAKNLVKAIGKISLDGTVNLMEVCGTHTHAIARFGIRNMLPESVKLLSGPGCPVCVTPNEYIDLALALAHVPGVTITTFGDMFRVPGSYSSLQAEKGRGADVKIVYSPYDALQYAKNNPERNVIFLGVGFETTAPAAAAAVLQAEREGVENFYILPGFKTLPKALEALAGMPDLNLQGLIAPGHLSVVMGEAMYEEALDRFGIASVITGFEPLDILEGIRMLLMMISEKKPAVANEYSRIVKKEGNKKAQEFISKVFQPIDSRWRGIGVIPLSGLAFSEEYSKYDGGLKFKVNVPPPRYENGCICGNILTGTKIPTQCPHFSKKCTPLSPLGACMVSSEGTCAAYYRYLRQI